VLVEVQGVLWICDVLWDGLGAVSFEALLQQVRVFASHKGCSRVSLWLEGDAELAAIVTSLGWQDGSHNHGVRLLMHAYDTTLDYQWIRSSLYITKADSDLI